MHKYLFTCKHTHVRAYIGAYIQACAYTLHKLLYSSGTVVRYVIKCNIDLLFDYSLRYFTCITSPIALITFYYNNYIIERYVINIPLLHSFVPFITEIYIAPLQGYYSEALPTLARLKRRVLRLE